jgi:hypothetical protein
VVEQQEDEMGPGDISRGIEDQIFGGIVRFAAVVALVAGLVAFAAGRWSATPSTPEQRKPDIRFCEGCGSRWETPNPEPNPQPITKCPNCPMTLEEFEELKDQVRRRSE